MIYVKSPLNDTVTVSIGIRPDNTFTRCPKCGKEIPVDLSTFDENELRNVMNYSLLCEECSLDFIRMLVTERHGKG